MSFLKLPYERARKGQLELAEKVYQSMLNKEDLIIEAPNGMGKTAALLAATFKACEDLGQRVIFLTRTKKQVDQVYMEGLKFKSIYPFSLISPFISYSDGCHLANLREPDILEDFLHIFCRVNVKTFSCEYYSNSFSNPVIDLPLSRLLKWSKIKRFCPIEVLRRRCSEASVIVGTYNSIIPRLIEGTCSFLRLDDNISLIIDEAHNISAFLSSYKSFITLNDLEWVYNLSIKRKLRDLSMTAKNLRVWLISRNYSGLMDVETFLSTTGLKDNIYRLLDLFKYSLNDFYEYLSFREALSLIRFISFIRRLEESWSSNTAYIMYEIGEESNYKITIREADVSRLLNKIRNNMRINSIIFSSATFFSIPSFKEELGIEKAEVFQIRYDPLKRTCITLLDTTISTRHTERSERLYKVIAEKIWSIYQLHSHPLLVFFTSYSMLRNTEKYLLSYTDKVMSESPKMTYDAVLKIVHDVTENNKILLAVFGGRFSEGVDFSHEKINRVIIVGIPFPPPSKELEIKIKIIRRAKRKRAFVSEIIVPAVAKVVQAAGRIFRKVGQKGIVYLIDERFLKMGLIAYLPEWLKSNLVIGDAVSSPIIVNRRLYKTNRD